MRTVLWAATAAAALLFLASCSSFVQTTSGESYLARADASGATLSEELRAAAAVEPIIDFPARIGVARIENGQLTDLPENEWDALSDAFQRPQVAANEFVPVSLFVIDLAAPRSPAAQIGRDRSEKRREVIDRLRLGGARQHLDAIIVYEVHGASSARQTALSIADLTLIGAYIAPGRRANAIGNATALMFDVRNGYPYGGAASTIERERLSPAFYAHDRANDLLKESQFAAVSDLAPKLVDVVSKLELEMARKSAGGAGAR